MRDLGAIELLHLKPLCLAWIPVPVWTCNPTTPIHRRHGIGLGQVRRTGGVSDGWGGGQKWKENI